MTAVANRSTRWCPRHENEIVKRSTLRCRRCTADLDLPRRRRFGVPRDRLKPMRRKGESTQRARERFLKDYAR